MKRIAKNTLGGAVAVAMTATCAMAQDIVVGVPNWPTANATSHIIKLALEQNLGLEVELQTGTNAIIFEGMDKGSMHVHPEVWLPNQQNLHDTFVTEKGSVAMNSNRVQGFTSVCIPKGFITACGGTSTTTSIPSYSATKDQPLCLPTHGRITSFGRRQYEPQKTNQLTLYLLTCKHV